MTDLTSYRNRHNREEHHFGTMEATLVELSSALDVDLPVGTTVEAAIAIIDARISRLENADVFVGTAKMDALIGARGFYANAILKGTAAHSFSSDAILKALTSASFSANAWVSGAIEGSFTFDAIQKALKTGTLLADAYIAAVGAIEGSFTFDAIQKKTMGDEAIPDFESVSAPKAIDSSDVSWTHTASDDTKGIVVFIFRGFGFGTPTVTYGGLTLTQRSGYAADPRVHAYTRTDLTGKASDTVRVQDATFTPYAYSILISNTRAIEYVDNVNGFGDTGYNDMFSAISTGWDGLAIMLGQEIGTGSGDHMSPYGTDVSWSTAVGYSTTPTKHWVWYGDVNDGDDVGTHHDDVIADQSFQAIAFRSIDRAAFAFTVDATVMPVFYVDAVILKTVAATFDMDAMIMPIFTIDAYIAHYFTIDAVIAEEGASTRDPLSDYDNHWHPRARVEEDGSSANTALITIEKYERSK